MARVGIVGLGYVGSGMLKIFPDAVQFDEPRKIGARDTLNSCDLAIVCVPTPSLPNGRCDISIVEEVVSWIECPLILIKSAIEPGTVDRLTKKYGKRIAVSPEYMGEGKYWTPAKYPDPQNALTHGFLILGGESKTCEEIADIFVPRVGPSTRIRIMPALEAEFVKYFENMWGATKVIFANTLRDICEKAGANWHLVREGWIDDPRVEPMHTAVFKDKRGFSGKCFPKDTTALIAYSKEVLGYDPLVLEAVIKANEDFSNRT